MEFLTRHSYGVENEERGNEPHTSTCAVIVWLSGLNLVMLKAPTVKVCYFATEWSQN